MRDTIVIAVLSTIAAALLCWVAALAWHAFVGFRDRRRVHAWLSASTKDEPGESHVDTLTIAKGVRLPEDRVRRACMTDPRVFRTTAGPELWSIWRQEKQSSYEKRGALVL